MKLKPIRPPRILTSLISSCLVTKSFNCGVNKRSMYLNLLNVWGKFLKTFETTAHAKWLAANVDPSEPGPIFPIILVLANTKETGKILQKQL